MSEPRIWTVSDFDEVRDRAEKRGSEDDLRLLSDHHFHADHCGGYEVFAWPCPKVVGLIRELFPEPDEDYVEIGESLRSAWGAACAMGMEGEERDEFMGQRAYSRAVLLYTQRERERRAAERAKEEADAEWEVIGGGGWRFKPVLQGGGSSFAYVVEVQKSNWPTSGWGKVGTDYTQTRWGARRVAKRIRRRHIRRFGEG